MGQCACHHALKKRRSPSAVANGNLSATFHILESELQWELLNVNTATEEELMSLPGISRTLARSIVEYRTALGGFKKVEDLALVSGVGASRLEQIRAEVCVGSRRAIVSSSSLGGGGDSSPRLVNLNSANVFSLMAIRGMTQEMAANIVHHRDRKGPFRTLDELLKVKSINLQNFANVKSFLTLDYMPPSEDGPSKRNGVIKLMPPLSSQLSRKVCPDPTLKAYQLLSPYSSRPVCRPLFSQSRRGSPAFRILLWNLNKLCTTKCHNPGAREVISRTILETGASLVLLEQVTKDAVDMLVSELNHPQLPDVRSWPQDPCRRWTAAAPSGHSTLVTGLVYNTSAHGLTLHHVASLEFQQAHATLGFFQLENLTFVLVTILSSSSSPSQIPFEILRPHLQDEQRIIISSSLTSQPTEDGLKDQGFTRLLLNSCSLWISPSLTSFFTGEKASVEHGLCHPIIPAEGWQWGGPVSPHLPHWLELFLRPPISNGHI